jgi:hypothetical protein
MAVFNDNNGPVLATGTVCTIEPIDQTNVPATVSSVGGDTQVFDKVSWFILGDASSVGTVALQLKDGGGTYRTVTLSPFPLTLAANAINVGSFTFDCHGARFVVTLSAGTLLVCELLGQMRFDE